MILVLVMMIVASALLYQQILGALVIDRDMRFAEIAAARAQAVLDVRAQTLTALATNPNLRQAATRERTLQEASDVLKVFDAGVDVANAEGALTTDSTRLFGTSIAAQDFFRRVRAERKPVFSDAMRDIAPSTTTTETTRYLMVVAVPILDEQDQFAGVLMGATNLTNTAFSAPIRLFRIGQSGFAYVVDRTGAVIFHPDADNLGKNFTDREFVREVIAGGRGGTLYISAEGEQVVAGFVPIGEMGWGVVVREPWSDVIAPVAPYIWLIGLVGLAVMIGATYLLARSLRRIEQPISALALQTTQVSWGNDVDPVPPSGIREIDILAGSFASMAKRLQGYRAGLRRYVGSVTNSHEDERRRIARELHDETIQNLLAISRQFELYQVLETQPEKQVQLVRMQKMLLETQHGIRRISRNLRPPALEDLGLVPSLRELVNQLPQAIHARSQTQLIVRGTPVALGSQKEVALYRITQEALSNIRRHAAATATTVQLDYTSDSVHLDIIDNGIGFVPPDSMTELTQADHFGLIGLQERVWSVGGTLVLTSSPGKGTRVQVRVPIGEA